MTVTADPRLDALLESAALQDGLVVALTGAGISAESGIPTFRGKEGYWRVGSRSYHPQELATQQAFSRMPEEIWRWYLMRLGVCRRAEPNAAHRALAELDRQRSSRFLLITQNVDGLHPRAGNSRDRLHEIHGDIGLMRCSHACSPELSPVPALNESTGDLRAALSCSHCGSWMRPHVLWFDEYYDERHYRWDSSLEAAARARLLVVIGTTGSTNLPLHVARTAAERGAAFIVVNPEPNIFSELALQSGRGVFLQGTAGRWVPEVVRRLLAGR